MDGRVHKGCDFDMVSYQQTALLSFNRDYNLSLTQTLTIAVADLKTLTVYESFWKAITNDLFYCLDLRTCCIIDSEKSYTVGEIDTA